MRGTGYLHCLLVVGASVLVIIGIRECLKSRASDSVSRWTSWLRATCVMTSPRVWVCPWWREV